MAQSEAIIFTEPSEIILMDSKIRIYAKNLEPLAQVTLSVDIRRRNVLYIGFGHFFANRNGVADSWSISFGGGWTGKRAMGLFTTMKPMPSIYSCPRLTMTFENADEILNFRVSAWNGHLDEDAIHQLHINCSTLGTSKKGKCNQFIAPRYMTSQFIQRTFLDASVQRTEVIVEQNGYPIRGVLFIPQANGQLPAIIDMYGATGGCVECRAALLASKGFVTLALAYCNYKDLQWRQFKQVPIGYFPAAIDWLMKHPKVEPRGGVGMVGVCEAAQAVLTTSLRDSRVKAAICMNSNLMLHTNVYHMQDCHTSYQPLKVSTGEPLCNIWARLGNIFVLLFFLPHAQIVIWHEIKNDVSRERLNL